MPPITPEQFVMTLENMARAWEQYPAEGRLPKDEEQSVLDDSEALQVPLVLGSSPPPHLRAFVALIRLVGDGELEAANVGPTFWDIDCQPHEAMDMTKLLARLRASPAWEEELLKLEGLQVASASVELRGEHLDLISKEFRNLRQRKVETGTPGRDEELRAAARKQAEGWKMPRVSRSVADRRAPTRIMGMGDPIMIGHGDKRRLFADGAGLCSPGLWEPHQRNPPAGIALRLHDALDYELGKLDKEREGGFLSLSLSLQTWRPDV